MHAYPRELASFVINHWEQAAGILAQESGSPPYASQPLPEPTTLEKILSTCYQASLLRDEERPVTFRAIFCPPEFLPAADGPPTGLHRLAFTRARPFNEDELRRISPSADFHRSLIGAHLVA